MTLNTKQELIDLIIKSSHEITNSGQVKYKEYSYYGIIFESRRFFGRCLKEIVTKIEKINIEFNNIEVLKNNLINIFEEIKEKSYTYDESTFKSVETCYDFLKYSWVETYEEALQEYGYKIDIYELTEFYLAKINNLILDATLEIILNKINCLI